MPDLLDDTDELIGRLRSAECDTPYYAARAMFDAADRLTALRARNAELERDARQAKAFIAALFDLLDWPNGGDLDGFAFQDLAELHGLLVPEMRSESCGEGCNCVEYGDFPMSCYRKVAWLRDAALAQATGQEAG